MSKPNLANGTQMVDVVTPIGGPTHEELRRPFQKSLEQIRNEQARAQRAAIDQLKRELERRK